MNRLIDFFRSAVSGYEPVMVRSIAAAVFVLLAAFGIGSGELPGQVEAILTFLAFIVPLVSGLLSRAKVVPTKRFE